jgi:hypothetical protein
MKWTEEEREALIALHGKMEISKIAKALGRSKGSVRGQITQMGIAKKERWTADEEDMLINAYTEAGEDGVVDLAAISKRLGRDKSNVCRKAKLLGLPTNQSRKKVAQRRPKPNKRKYKTDEELSKARSEIMRKRHAERGHPMQGKTHSPENRAKMSKRVRKWWAELDGEGKQRFFDRCAEGRKASNYSPPKMKRGSWKAQWREIGGKRNFYRSAWEANYACYLQWLKERGEIKEWEHEPKTFWFDAIKRGVRSYKPDFQVWENNGSYAWHEVKGWMDSRSKTTLRRMAKYYPEEKLILIDAKAYKAIKKRSAMFPGWED